MTGTNHNSGWWLWNINPVALLLWPLSLIFCLLVWIRRKLYQWHWLRSEHLSVPVIVVGNISVGGNGKTPVVVSLTTILKQRDFEVGILTRGYKSDHEHQTQLLAPGQISDRVGDEANMLSELCNCPIAVGADRIKAGRALLDQFPSINLLIADDGLQHYTMSRDIEIIVTRERANGNRFCLPAGPLREPLRRLNQADLVIQRDGAELRESFAQCWNLKDPLQTCELSDFRGHKIQALAGIGFPDLFFSGLIEQGLDMETHAYPDHYQFTAQDIKPFQSTPLLVTHKDAVKLRAFATENIWVVPLELTMSDDLQYRLINLLESKLHG